MGLICDMDSINLSRQQLYELVWNEPLSKLCKRYQISDVGLRKICFRLDIPLPKAGHWNKVLAGKSVKQLPLNFNENVPKEITFKIATGEIDSGKNEPSHVELLQKQIVMDNANELIVRVELLDPDPLVIRAKKSINKSEKWYRVGCTVTTEPGELRINVTPELVNRALSILDTFIKVMKKRGHSFRATNRDCILIIGQQTLEMSLVEVNKRNIVEGRLYPQTELQPNGKLALKFKRSFESIEIRDGKLTIGQQLSRVIARLELYAEELRIRAIEYEKQRKLNEEKRLEREAFEARKKLEINAFKQALRDSARWRKCEDLRNFIIHVESTLPLDEEKLAWLDWLKRKTDWFDPLKESPDEWLTGTDPFSLMDETFQVQERSYWSPPYQKESWPLLPWYLKK